jgi:F-type H+-transporting ATPase subunit b
MKRWTLIFSSLFLIVMSSSVPALAAEAAGEAGEANSPLYTPAQGLITGIVTIVIFVLLLVVLGKYAWGPILSGLKAREEKIRKDIAEAESMRVRAEATLREYNQQLTTAEQKVRDMLEKAAADAEKIAARLRTQAQNEAQETRERAVKDIEAARAQALSEIYEQTADLATRVAEKILRRNLNAEDQRGLVDQSLRELQTAGA